MSLQSGGNAIPLGKRKLSSQDSPTAGSGNDSDSSSDGDMPLPGEMDSEEEYVEMDSGSDSSQLQLPTDGFDVDSMSEWSDASQASDSNDDARQAAEQHPTASRQNTTSEVKASHRSHQQLSEEASSSGDEQSNDDSQTEEKGKAEAAYVASRRTSHQVDWLSLCKIGLAMHWRCCPCSVSELYCLPSSCRKLCSWLH